MDCFPAHQTRFSSSAALASALAKHKADILSKLDSMTDSEMLELERRFWMGDADVYRDLLTADCRMALPGMGLVDRQAAIDGIATGPRWDEVEFTQVQLQRLGDDCIVVSYRASARRAASPYEAVIVSVFALQDGQWKLAYHQQTANSLMQNEP